MSDRTRAVMQDEALAPGKVFTIQLSMLERFVDERPATLLRNETKGAQRKLFVRDETNGVVRAFVKALPLLEADFSELQPTGKRAVLVDPGGGEDRVVMHAPARIDSCSVCEERGVFGALARDGAVCARCITLTDVAEGGVDADFARALVRHELAAGERAAGRALLARLDGVAPWTFLAEKFAQPEWGFEEILSARKQLVQRTWRRAIGDEVGTVLDIVHFGSPAGHPWIGEANRLRFTVRESTLTAHNGDVVAVRNG